MLDAGCNHSSLRDIQSGKCLCWRAVVLDADLGQFFMIVITGSIFQLFGPMPEKNSRFYSCKFGDAPLMDLRKTRTETLCG
jgi:hypothetical protein